MRSRTNAAQIVEPIWAKYVGSQGDELKAGEGVCYKAASAAGTAAEINSTAGIAQANEVETPSFANLAYPAGVIMDTSAGKVTNSDGTKEILIMPIDEVHELGNQTVYTDQSITAGDLLGLGPGSRTFRRSAGATRPLLRATQTKDRSSTAGLVRGQLNPMVSAIEYQRKHFVVQDDFPSFLTAVTWATYGATGTNAASDSNSGAVTITTGGTEEHVQGFKGAVKNFTLASGNPLFFECVVQCTEVSTNTANLFFGLQSAAGTTTTLLKDAGAGLADASLDAVGFYKLDGGLQLVAASQRSASTARLTTNVAGYASATWIKLSMYYNGLPITSGGGGRVLFAVNDTLVATLGGTTAGDELKLPNAAMFLTCHVKTGTGSAQTAIVDRILCVQAKAYAVTST